MALRDVIARTTRNVLARLDDFAEDLQVDDRVSDPVAFRGVVDRATVAEPGGSEGELLVERITVTAALGGTYGLAAVPVPGKWRVYLAPDVGGAAAWCRVGAILSQDPDACTFEVLR